MIKNFNFDGDVYNKKINVEFKEALLLVQKNINAYKGTLHGMKEKQKKITLSSYKEQIWGEAKVNSPFKKENCWGNYSNNLFLKVEEMKEIPIDHKILILYYMGIGVIYKNMSNDYLNKVLFESRRGTIGLIISDMSISHGTNLPIDEIIIDESLNNENLSDIYQLISRCGRLGLSTKGNLLVDDFMKERLFNAFNH